MVIKDKKFGFHIGKKPMKEKREEGIENYMSKDSEGNYIVFLYLAKEANEYKKTHKISGTVFSIHSEELERIKEKVTYIEPEIVDKKEAEYVEPEIVDRKENVNETDTFENKFKSNNPPLNEPFKGKKSSLKNENDIKSQGKWFIYEDKGKCISQQDFAIHGKTSPQAISQSYYRQEKIKNHSWEIQLNSRIQRIYDAYAAKNICADLKIPAFKLVQDKIKKEAIPDLLDNKYVPISEIEKIEMRIIDNFNGNFSRLESNIEAGEKTQTEFREDILQKFDEHKNTTKEKNAELKKIVAELKNDVKRDGKLLLLYGKKDIKIIKEFYSKLSEYSIVYIKWALKNNYKTGTYALWWGSPTAIEAGKTLFALQNNYPEIYDFINIDPSSEILLCSITNAEIPYREDCTQHHVIMYRIYGHIDKHTTLGMALKKIKKHIDFEKLYIPDTQIHRIVPILREAHNKLPPRAMFFDELLEWKRRYPNIEKFRKDFGHIKQLPKDFDIFEYEKNQ